MRNTNFGGEHHDGMSESGLHVCIGTSVDPWNDEPLEEFVPVLTVFSETSSVNYQVAFQTEIARSSVLDLCFEAFVGERLVHEAEHLPGFLAKWLSGSPSASGCGGEHALLGDVEPG